MDIVSVDKYMYMYLYCLVLVIKRRRIFRREQKGGKEGESLEENKKVVTSASPYELFGAGRFLSISSSLI